MSYGLGRLHIPDNRDRQFRMQAPRTTQSVRYWHSGGVFNQGNFPHCVAYSCDGLLKAGPIKNMAKIDRVKLYQDAQKIDQWPGEDYEGTSVRAGMAVLKTMGFIERYTWAWDPEATARHILEIGPVVAGTTWTYDMFEPDKRGYIWPTGGEAGGHAYLLIGVNLNKANPDGTVGAFRIVNSWGPFWGQNGRAWITFKQMGNLIDDYGEACAATERKLAA